MKLRDKEFIPYISEEKIKTIVKNIAEQIKIDYHDKNPLFLVILNGAFMFAADLIRNFDFNVDVTFVKLSSYQKTQSTGDVEVLLGLQEKIENRNVIIIEDIVDTGTTVKFLNQFLRQYKPLSLEVATLLLKPEIFDNAFPLKYAGLEIPNKFVVGYGLDYDGLGRNLKDIYQIKEN